MQRALGRSGTRISKYAEKPDSVRVVMRRAMHRTWKHLARERLRDIKPNIPLGERFWPLSRQEAKAIQDLFRQEPVRRLVASLKSRDDGAKVEVLDAAYWMKGCSSLGKLRYAVLLNVGNGKRNNDDFCLVDIKEANPAAAPRARVKVDAHGQCQASSRGRAAPVARIGEAHDGVPRLLGRSVFLRELMPQDLKLEIDQLSRDEAVSAARFLAGVVGKAHARQYGSTPSGSEFRKEPPAARSKRMDAPPWLWSSVVELAATHEGGISGALPQRRSRVTSLRKALPEMANRSISIRNSGLERRVTANQRAGLDTLPGAQ